MTYIVGGTPRAGKSTIQNIFLKKFGVPGLSTDLLREALTYGVPSYGLREEMTDDFERAELLWPFFKGMFKARKRYTDDLLIEGTNFLPKYLTELKNDKEFKICFLGYCEVDPMEKFNGIRQSKSHDDNWTDDESDESLMSLVHEFIETSKYFRDECEKYGLKYFDTSKDFDKTIRDVVDYLRS